jgi:ComF family protein
MCSYCKIFLSVDAFFCNDCQQLILPVVSISMPIAKKYTMPVIAVSAYHDPLKALILAKGWRDVRASRVLGSLIWQMTDLRNLPIDYFVPIPLHWTRYAQRGFNQAEQMAHALKQQSAKPTANLLQRRRNTPFQSTLTPHERAANVRHVFTFATSMHKEQYQGKHLVLVDDLMTTGSTLQAAAKELIQLEPASLTAVVACRVI